MMRQSIVPALLAALVLLAGCGLFQPPPPPQPALPPLAGTPCLAPLPDGTDVDVRDLRMRMLDAGTDNATAIMEACVVARAPFRLTGVHLDGVFLAASLFPVCWNDPDKQDYQVVCSNGQGWNDIDATSHPIPGMPAHVVVIGASKRVGASFGTALAPAAVVRLNVQACVSPACDLLRDWSLYLTPPLRILPPITSAATKAAHPN